MKLITVVITLGIFIAFAVSGCRAPQSVELHPVPVAVKVPE